MHRVPAMRPKNDGGGGDGCLLDAVEVGQVGRQTVDVIARDVET